MQTVTIQTLVDDTGEKVRTLQHWADLGILKPLADSDKRGRGVYRHFAAAPQHGERPFALLASALAKHRLPLGDIRDIVEGFRAHCEPLAHAPTSAAAKNVALDPTPGETAHDCWQQAIDAEKEVICLINARQDGTPAYYIPLFTYEKVERNDDGVLEVAAPDTVFPYQRIIGFLSKYPSGIALNLTGIFSPLHRRT